MPLNSSSCLESGTHDYSTNAEYRDHRNRKLSSEMKGHFVGPMPPRDFLDNFLPTRTFKTDGNQNRWADLAGKSKEAAMYDPFVSLASHLLQLIIQLGHVVGQGCERSN
jgi:hypothetical protein